MSQMSPKKVRMPSEKRKEIIKLNIASKTQDEIAELCGVVRETITRDIIKMRASGEWRDFIEYEALRLHREIGLKEDPLTAYKEFMKLYAKTITTKTEVKTEGEMAHKIGVEDDLGEFITEYLPIVVELLIDEQDKELKTTTEDTSSRLDTPQTDPEADEVSTVG